MILPWQQTEWLHVWHAKNNHRLPHALLLSGASGLGKAQFADTFSQALLCLNLTKDNLPCNVCHACRLSMNKTHPNILWVTPEKAGHAIKVDQIRIANEFIQQSAFSGDYKIVIIHAADDMNINAANALLKTLEEPSAQSLIILITAQSKRLPATILSRCQRVQFKTPDAQTALAWLKEQVTEQDIDLKLLLKLTQGAPLAALQFLQDEQFASRKMLLDTLCLLSEGKGDLIKLAGKLEDIPPLTLIDFTLSFTLDLLYLQLSQQQELISNYDYIRQLTTLSQHKSISSHIKFIAYLQMLRAQICVGINFNSLLLVENILFKWLEQPCT